MDFEILVLVVIVAGFAVLYFFMRQLLSKRSDGDMSKMVDEVFGRSAEKIAEQSKRLLAGDRDAIKIDLANKQQMLEGLVTRLQKDLSVRQDELRSLEKDRSHKFAEIVTSLTENRKLTGELAQSTEQLAKVLSNNQARGEWGERIIEDLLRVNGLIEGVHFARQTKQLGGTARPDITLLLPDNRVVPVDVKFPYADIQKLASSSNTAEKVQLVKQLRINIRAKIAKVAEYIQPDANTLDYAILFVPNEMVFSFLNQKFPEVLDEALQQRVIVVSPFSFIIVARTVRESYRNFMIGGKLKEVIKHIDGFVSEWSKFSEHLSKYGRSLSTLHNDYEALMGTRHRQLERKIEQVKIATQGSLSEGSQQKKLLD
ncbi:MAG: DNA recombination protein RmuC [Candidatus Pacebacteria bacterium]|nr:DNA recombination protein RmuC [Candidatus Paceibacterota bacterium]